MKKIKTSLSIISILMLGLFMSSCKKSPAVEEDPEKATITLNKSIVDLAIGEAFTFIATVKGSSEKVTWSSSNNQVVTVVDGKATAVSKGTATITAMVGEKSAKATINVSEVPFPVLSVSQEKVELIIGGAGVTVTPTLKFDGKVVSGTYTWTVEDDKVARVTNGLVEAVGSGQTRVTVSTTYNGEMVEKKITVIVSIDASVLLTSYDVQLDAIDVDGTQNVLENISISAFVNGTEITDQVFTIELNDNFVEYNLVGKELAITPLLPGTTKLTVSFIHEDVKVSSVIDIVVSKVEVEKETGINFDLSQSQNNALDLSALGITDVISITSNGEIISSETNASLLKTSFLETVSTGDVKNIKIETKFITYMTQIKFVNNYKAVEFMSAENGNGSTYKPYEGDVTALGFEADATVFEFYTGTVADAWSSRLQTTEPVSGYDWWLMDFVLTEPLTGQITLWIGMFHVVTIQPSGQATLLEKGDNYTGDIASYNNVNVYNQEAVRQTKGLDANVVYTIEINLSSRSDDPRDSFGVKASTTMYLSNIFAASQSYYLENVGEKDDPIFNQTHNVELALTEDNTVGATYNYNSQLSAYEFNTGNSTGAWANRLQTTDVKVQGYDFMVFDMMLTTPLSAVINFWMDMLNVSVLNPDGTTNNEDVLYIYNEADELITSGLSTNQIYTFVIRLAHKDEEGRYAFGFNQDTTVYIRNVMAATADYIETRYGIQSLAEQFEFDFSLTSDNTIGATLTYNEGAQSFVYYSGASANAWANRLQLETPNITSYDYIFFDLMLTAPLSTLTSLWMDMSSVIALQADGTIDKPELLAIFDSNKNLVTGALLANEVYTFVVNIKHAPTENRYAFGFNEETTLYVRNSFATTQGYYDEFISTAVIPKPESIAIELDLTADNTVGATKVYVESLGAYEVNTGVETSPWANRLQSNNPLIKDYDYLVFNLLLTEALTTPTHLWMDMLSVTTLNADGTRDTENLVYIFNAEKELVTGALSPGAEYTFVVKLGHLDEEGRYAIGFNQDTKLYIRTAHAVTTDYVNTNFVLEPVAK